MVRFSLIARFFKLPNLVRFLDGKALCFVSPARCAGSSFTYAERFATQPPGSSFVRNGLRTWLVVLTLIFPVWLAANEAAPAAQNPQLEVRVMKIAAELRCLVCQNQTIADSNAGLAVDLRAQVRTMLQEGKAESEIIDYMTARYGDFVLYRPPVKTSTLLLWAGPGVMLVGGLGILFWVLRKRSRMAPEHFDPDSPDPVQDPHLS
jgi:cytochrome c-type biogenesis protein CcmH